MKKMIVCVLVLLSFSAALLSLTLAQNPAGYTASSSVASNTAATANTAAAVNSNAAGTANASAQINPGARTTNVVQLANTTAIFGPNKAESINITQVNTAGGRWIGITNQGIAATNLSGWRLMNRENFVYVFPNVNLFPGSIIKVHEGTGRSSTTDLYTNSTAPLFSGSADLITLLDAQGEIASQYNTSGVPATTAATANANPSLAVNATTPAAVKSQTTQPVLVTPGSPGVSQNPAHASVLVTNPFQPNATARGNGTCPAGQILCNGTCTDTSLDPLNCGSCGNVCPADSTCFNGACTSPCLSGQTNCNGNCVDTSSDQLNCGSCGKACPANAVCVNGVCQAYPSPGSQ